VSDASSAAGPAEGAAAIHDVPEALVRDAAKLAERARALGADHVAPLSAAGIAVDERVRLKCLVPRCSSYGSNLMCPPAVPEPDAMRAAVSRYRIALVVQRRIPSSAAAVDAAFAGRTYAEAHADGDLDVGGVLASQRAFARLMSLLEREAFALGYRFAAGFGGGECVLCEECVGQGSGAPCKHPFEARPSAEALGVDLVATAQAAGLDVQFPAADDARWTGLLLID
jgi:predicted metal-binding protein